MRTHSALSLIVHFQDLPDPRVARTKEHRLIDLLVIAVCTLPPRWSAAGRARTDWSWANSKCATRATRSPPCPNSCARWT